MCVHELPYYFRFHPAALKYLPECILMNTIKNNLNISLKLIFSIIDIYLVKNFWKKITRYYFFNLHKIFISI